MVLFSIPIYSCSEKKHRILYQKFLRNKALLVIENYKKFGKSEQEAIEKTEPLFWKKRIWKYNQIIGYLEVNIMHASLSFNSYLQEERNIMKFSNKKKYLTLHPILGYYVQLGGNNGEIAENLLKTIEKIGKSFKWELDLSSFKLIYKDINYLGFKGKYLP